MKNGSLLGGFVSFIGNLITVSRFIDIFTLDQVILGVLLGSILGISFCHILKYAKRRGFIDRESFIAQYLALAFLTIGIASTLGLDDLLAAFAAGGL